MTDAYLIELIYTQTSTTTRPGGQHAGNPATSIRVTHVASGISAQCGWHLSTHRNKRVALEMVHWGLVAIGLDPEPEDEK